MNESYRIELQVFAMQLELCYKIRVPKFSTKDFLSIKTKDEMTRTKIVQSGGVLSADVYAEDRSAVKRYIVLVHQNRIYLNILFRFLKPTRKFTNFINACNIIPGPRQTDSVNCGVYALMMAWTFLQGPFLDRYVKYRPTCNTEVLTDKVVTDIRKYGFVCSRAIASIQLADK
jgi:hypothetical protein